MTASSGERVEQYNAVTRDSTGSCEERPQVQVVSSNPLDNLDFSSKEFRAGVDNLATSLKVRLLVTHVISSTHVKSSLWKASQLLISSN